MWIVLLSLCVLLRSNSAEEVMLLDTTESTSELGWTTYPDTGWDEVSVLDDRGKLIRTFEVCNINQNSHIKDNWLATPFLYRHSAPRVFVTLRFSVRDCASLRSPLPTCRETLTLYYKQADSQRELEKTWVAEPSSSGKDTREGWVKIDTIAADKSFSKVEPSSPHQYQPNRYSRINVKTRSFAPLTRNGFVLAVVDSGACVSLMGVSVFFRRCPATSLYLASYPATLSGAEPTALVSVSGTCVTHSKAHGGIGPRMHCNAEGEWMVPVGGCTCDEGYEPNINGSACLACPVGYFKTIPGSVSCSVCPPNSRTSQEGSSVCECRSGFYRAANDANSSACTTPPSAPVSPSWEYESGDGGVSLRWRPPVDKGGRSKVWYGVVCRICPSPAITNPASCSWCGEGVTFSPAQTNLTQSSVTLHNLLTRVTYLIQVQAMNEVSSLSPFPARYASINFTTSQSVPSTVPMMHQLSHAPDSITLSWPQPDRPNGDILEYQVRYFDKGSDVDGAVSVYSETNTLSIGSLIPGSIYAFQIRARNERGYGPYSNTIYFTTLPLAQFGEVSRGRYRPPGRREVLVAVKTLRWGASDREKGMFLSEAGVLGQFDHPNVLKLEGVVTRVPPPRIVTEFMENGPLDSFLRENEGQFSVLQLVGMLRGIGAGMRYLSERNFVHRDLAARNVLVNSNLVCKVSDFGLSRLMRSLDHNMPTYTASLGSRIPVRWTAPEAFQHRKFSSASDVWSFGILMWEVMSYGERPYWDMSNQEVMKAVADQYRLPAPTSCPSALHSLMLQCWQAERGERPGFESILSSLDRLIRHPVSLKTDFARSCSQPLLSPTPTDFSSVATVGDWLRALRMERYQDEFDRAHLDTLDRVSRLAMEDIQNLGVNLLGHQRKIFSAAQRLKAHLSQGQVEV
uniref:ephrin type-B receptor 5 isoform X4 n=1 Tax=Doryrhamphus excisus TaxID=161450 RepID=UPI0025AE5B75|nr:ephrin type-B receptor 5 isoform X4 [Doryrhamphus excisus]